jgi:hypothetical protein
MPSFLTDTENRETVKTLVALPTSLRVRLARIADREETHVASVIRRGLHDWVDYYEGRGRA